MMMSVWFIVDWDDLDDSIIEFMSSIVCILIMPIKVS